MCGIAGILDWSGRFDGGAHIDAMTDALAHRGPDGRGTFADGPVALGHRRLSIIDLSPEAGQPFHGDDGRHVIVYNGELYNFRELRAELEALGRRFRTRSDTEVVLQAVAAWGTDALTRFNGMFAFALWDRHARRLLLARDRYGVKPLYYTVHDGMLLFGSEAKALFAGTGFSAAVDRPALLEYFTFQNFFGERTLFDGVRLFPAGSHLWLDAAAQPRAIAPRRYWDYTFEEPSGSIDPREYVEELERLMRNAVTRQMVSDVEVGAYLSGGIDSASVTAFAAAANPSIKTFTAGFDMSSASGLEAGFDEREKAEAMSYLFRTEHYECVLKAGDMQRAMPGLAWHIEEPRVGQSYPIFLAARLASRFVKVVLSGAGGDELFGGYPWRYYRAVVNDDFDHYVDKYYLFWQRLIPNTTIRKVFAPIWSDVEHVWTRDIFKSVFPDGAHRFTRPEDYVNHSLYFEAKTFLHSLLVIEDKLSMAHGLESRVPFLDNDLVDFAMRVPARLKLGNLQEVVRLDENVPGVKTAVYYQRTRDGKRILRDMIARQVPEEISNRPKQGFSGPDASWFRGESIDFVRENLCRPDARIYDYLDRAAVGALLDDHLSGRENRRLLIWSLLSFEQWCRTFAT